MNVAIALLLLLIALLMHAPRVEFSYRDIPPDCETPCVSHRVPGSMRPDMHGD